MFTHLDLPGRIQEKVIHVFMWQTNCSLEHFHLVGHRGIFGPERRSAGGVDCIHAQFPIQCRVIWLKMNTLTQSITMCDGSKCFLVSMRFQLDMSMKYQLWYLKRIIHWASVRKMSPTSCLFHKQKLVDNLINSVDSGALHLEFFLK